MMTMSEGERERERDGGKTVGARMYDEDLSCRGKKLTRILIASTCLTFPSGEPTGSTGRPTDTLPS